MSVATVGVSTFGSSALVVYIMQKLKSASWFPLVDQGRVFLNRLVSVFGALCTTIAVSYVWNPSSRQLLLTIPTLSVMLLGLWHWFTHFAMQETIYQATVPGNGLSKAVAQTVLAELQKLGIAPAQPNAKAIPQAAAKTILPLVLLLVIPLCGCSVYKYANNTVNVIGQIISIAQADLPGLESSGVIATADAPAITNWLNGLATLDSQAKTCVATAGTSGTKAALTSCITTFAEGLLNPTELATLRVLSPKSQQKVELYATAITLGLNAYCDIEGCASITPPAISSTPASAQDIQAIRDRIGL